MTDGEAAAATPLLEGLRVVEISQLIAAPLCGLTLHDWGADVIKVEPLEGEYARTLEPDLRPGESAYFQMLNRGKRSVAIDYRAPPAAEFLAKLIDGADVLLESLGDGGAGIGISYEDAASRNPALIWCSITGQGRDHGGRAIDPTLQASMGMMALTGEPGGAPMRLPVPLIDFMTGSYATQSVLAALLRVRGGGPGALLDCAMVDVAATMTSSAGVYALGGAPPLRRMGTENRWYVPAGNFEASDGDWVQLIAVGEHHWRALARGLGHPEWLDDPRLASNEVRLERRGEVHDMLAAVIAERPASHWEREVRAAGGFCQRIREIEEAWADPLLAARGLVAPLAEGADAGFPVPVASLARTAVPAEGLPPAPRLGQHTEEIAGELGLA
jgi:crotonobetainyl-CoA:carnitine CoA-transferase CaiB-like acyl-CoA transferase